MLKQLQKKKEEGFTIIEVMIVLAIAGLIILVVLLAIPALQRNSRNTTIKNDAAAVAAAIQEFQSANNGKLPSGNSAVVSAIGDSTVEVKGAEGTTSTKGNIQGGTKVGIFTGEGSAVTTMEFSEIGVKIGTKCNENGTSLGQANARSIALVYKLETSSGQGAPQCLDS